MKRNTCSGHVTALPLLLGAALLAGCGAGSSNSNSLSATTSSTSATGSGTAAAAASNSTGVISAFGSVFVNGHEYRVDGATSIVDGDADDAVAAEGALKVGMMVNLAASSDNATQLRFTSAVRGEIDAIDTGSSTLTVMGQPVIVSSGTSFAGSKSVGGVTTTVSSLANLSVGDYVVVYGYQDCISSTSTTACTGGATRVLASLVYEPAAAGVYRTLGYAQNVDGTARTFTINGLTVAYPASGATVTACTPSPCAIASGDYVEVRSAAAPVSSAGTLTLTASRIRSGSNNAPVVVAGQTASVEGPVANLDTTLNRFTLRGVSIDGSALAATVATLTTGQIVSVTGTVAANGSLTATAITVEHQATLAVVAPLSAESGTANTLTVLGRSFTVSSATRFVDLAHNTQPFNATNFATVLAAGDQLEVSAYDTAAGPVATRVTRLPTPATPYVAVQGVVTAASAATNTLTIGGIDVTLGAATTLHYRGAVGMPTVAGFIGAITVNSSVASVRGAVGATANSVTANAATLLDSGSRWAAGGF